ncbi:hypothetical protein ACQFX9_14785 [Aliinostoc sp. HNIBRCY26]|uniref:hypothetical protein n=1 Tax=Aliinostoc sp. HNIBRCY26 TaxID=3418997 RepID=UPI003D063580
MKLNHLFRLAAITVLTAFSFVSTINTALADYLSSEGMGGKYRYELWQSDNNTYYLKIWLQDASSGSRSYTTTSQFSSSRDALIYFDCNYAQRDLPECS